MMRVALVHDWLVTHRGGEQVLLELARAFPSAPIYTLVYDRKNVHPELQNRDVRTSFIQKLPRVPKHFRRYLPLFPKAIEQLDLSGYDLVISTSHCVAKGARASGLHISYVHTPMRYLWDQLPTYVPRLPEAARASVVRAVEVAVTPLRKWDVASSKRPTELIANSRYVANRIQRVWARHAHVVHPPVAVDFWNDAPERKREGYLVVSALVPYKRVDVAVDAAVAFGFPLTVIGSGPERRDLQKRAGGRVRFLAGASNEQLREAYASAKALLFCGVEDFGIVPVEAQAAGCPVIALGEGGVLETVVDGMTGVLFADPEPAILGAAISSFERMRFDRGRLMRHAKTFSVQSFRDGMRERLAAHGVAFESPI
jgi:glycosyltransferase involved in cell wall biosynthesis